MASSSSSSALLKEAEKFNKRQAEAAAFLATNEKRQKLDKTPVPKPNRPKSTFARSKTSSDFSNDHRSSASSKSKFFILSKIVDGLHDRFVEGINDPLTLDEMVTEFELTVDPLDRHWLASGALLSNEKIDVVKEDDVDKFVFKPPLDLKDQKRQALLNLLKSRHEKGEGGVLVDDVRDSMARAKAEKIIDGLIKSGDAIKVAGANRKEVLFFTDRAYDLQVNPEFVESWRKISVEGMDNKKIVEFLDNQGHRGLAKNAPKPVAMPTKPSRRGGRRTDAVKFNRHVMDQLEDFSDGPTTKKI